MKNILMIMYLLETNLYKLKIWWIFTYLKTYILRDDAFDFLTLIPSNVLSLLQSFDLGALNDILLAVYIVVYIVFEVLIIKTFIKKKF